MNQTQMFTLLFRGGTLFLWMSVIFFFSSLPGNPDIADPPFFFYVERKGAHIVEYMLLSFFAFRFFSALSPRQIPRTLFLLAFLFSITYGISDEFHQSFTPYRSPKATDVLIDTGGALLGCIGAFFFLKRKNRIKSQNEAK